MISQSSPSPTWWLARCWTWVVRSDRLKGAGHEQFGWLEDVKIHEFRDVSGHRSCQVRLLAPKSHADAG